MKKVVLLLLVCIVMLTACGSDGSLVKDALEGIASNDDVMDFLKPGKGKNDSVMPEIDNSDEQWMTVSTLKLNAIDGFNYYFVQAHIGVVVNGSFVRAALETSDFTLNSEIEAWRLMDASSSNAMGNYVIVTDNPLSTVSVDWSVSNYSASVFCDNVNTPLSEVQPMFGHFDEWKSRFVPISGEPFRADGNWVRLRDYVYRNNIVSGGKLLAFPVVVFGDLTMKELADYISDHFIIAARDNSNYEYKYEVVDSIATASAYGDKDLGFGWHNLDNTSLATSGYPLECFIYINYDPDVLSGINGIEQFGFELPNGDIIFIDTLS